MEGSMIDRERELIRNYDDAHRAYLEAMEAVRAAVFGRTGPADGAARYAVEAAKTRLSDAERELQEYWSKEAVAQEVSR
jgi:hypothetical protein